MELWIKFRAVLEMRYMGLKDLILVSKGTVIEGWDNDCHQCHSGLSWKGCIWHEIKSCENEKKVSKKYFQSPLYRTSSSISQ